MSCSRDISRGLHRRVQNKCNVLACLSHSLPAHRLSVLAWLDNCITYERDDVYTVQAKIWTARPSIGVLYSAGRKAWACQRRALVSFKVRI